MTCRDGRRPSTGLLPTHTHTQTDIATKHYTREHYSFNLNLKSMFPKHFPLPRGDAGKRLDTTYLVRLLIMTARLLN